MTNIPTSTSNLAQKFSQLEVDGTKFSESDYEAPLNDIEIEAENKEVIVAGLKESENEILTDLFNEHFGDVLGFDTPPTEEQKELRDLILKEAAEIADVNDGTQDGNTTIEAILNAVPKVLERYDAPTTKEQAMINATAAEIKLFEAASSNITSINLPDGNQILLDNNTIETTKTNDGQTITGSVLRSDGQEETVILQYNQQGDLQTATFVMNENGQEITQTATYENGQVDTLSGTILNGDGTVSEYEVKHNYDEQGNLISEEGKSVHPDKSDTTYKKTHGYDDNGTRTSSTQVITEDDKPSVSKVRRYDAQGQKTSEVEVPAFVGELISNDSDDDIDTIFNNAVEHYGNENGVLDSEEITNFLSDLYGEDNALSGFIEDMIGEDDVLSVTELEDLLTVHTYFTHTNQEQSNTPNPLGFNNIENALEIVSSDKNITLTMPGTGSVFTLTKTPDGGVTGASYDPNGPGVGEDVRTLSDEASKDFITSILDFIRQYLSSEQL